MEEPINPLYGTRNVDLNIKYWTDMPEDFLWFIPFVLRNLILYGSRFPKKTIHLSLDNIPEFATCSISPPDIEIVVPQGDNFIERSATFQIYLYPEAPAFQPFSVYVDAVSCRSGLIKQSSDRADIILIADLLPLYSIYVNDTIIDIVSGEKANISMVITNNGNGRQIIDGIIIPEYDESKLDLSLTPNIVSIEPDESKNMTLEIQTIYYPQQNTYEQVIIEFTSSNPYTGIKYEPVQFNLGIHIHS